MTVWWCCRWPNPQRSCSSTRPIFDRFSQATGVTIEDLDTWEGLYRAAEIYADWTDDQTPDIPGDAKSMFVHDYYFNYFQVGAQSLGEDFFRGDVLAFGPAFQTAWEPLARAALRGGVWLKGGYATESIRTGDSIVSVRHRVYPHRRQHRQRGLLCQHPLLQRCGDLSGQHL